MKYSYLGILTLFFSCTTTDKPGPEEVKNDFINTAKNFHHLYISAGDCSERNALVDKDIVFFENRQQFTYQDILDYCSYIKPKNPFNIYSKQYMIQPTIGFD